MSEIFYDGDQITIKGVITKNSNGTKNSSDVYSRDSDSGNTWDVRDHIPEAVEATNQASQTVLQTVVAKASEAGLSGVIAMGTAVGFQVDAIHDNYVAAVSIATPMVHELVETGTITPPEGSKYENVEIPTTTSFLGVKVGEERKRQQAYDKLTPDQKAAQDGIKESTRPPDPRTQREREASTI